MEECTIIAKDGARFTLKAASTIPYFEGWLSCSDEPGVVNSDIDSELLKPIVCYSNSHRLCHLFKYLSSNASATRLLSTMDFLAIDMNCRLIDDLQADLKDVHDDIERHRHYTLTHHIANRVHARDAAAEYCIGLCKGLYSDKKWKSKIYETTFFIASHTKTFSRRIRYHVVKESQQYLSIKQMSQINKWKWITDKSDDDDHTEGEEREEQMKKDEEKRSWHREFYGSDSD